MSLSSVNRAHFAELLYKFQDMLLEFEAYVNEYDCGLPIIRDTTPIHQFVDRMKRKLPKLLEDYESSSDDSTESIN